MTKKYKQGEKVGLDVGWKDQVVEIKRVTKVLKGGKRLRFRVLMVVGDKNGVFEPMRGPTDSVYKRHA